MEKNIKELFNFLLDCPTKRQKIEFINENIRNDSSYAVSVSNQIFLGIARYYGGEWSTVILPDSRMALYRMMSERNSLLIDFIDASLKPQCNPNNR